MMCTNCQEFPILAKGVCKRCYDRLRRRGTLQRTNVQNAGRFCSVEGCGKAAHARGMCATHYEDSRHPMNHLWRQLRSRNPDGYPFAWNRFEAFLTDVGEQPGPRHQLRKIEHDRPFSKDNFQWLAPIVIGRDSYSKEDRSAYAREHNLQRKFRITGEDYAALLIAQGGGCAICGGKETHTYASGKIKDLSVDHDHKTGDIRGLLCFNCNQGLGRFQDSLKVIRAAAAYLERHQPTMICEDAAE